MKFGVAGSLELLEDDFVGARTGVNQRGAENGQRATVLDVARRTEELLRLDERRIVNAARSDLARVGKRVVVATGEARDRVEQNHNMLAELNHATRLLHHHLGDLDVADRFFVEGACDNLDMRRRVATEVGDFLGTLVDEKDDHMNILVIGGDGVGDLLQNHGLAGARRSDDERALAEAQRRNHVDHARFDLARAKHLKMDALVRVERGEVLEGRKIVDARRVAAVHALNAQQREVDLLVLGRTNDALDHMTATKAKMPDLRGRNIHIVGRWAVGVVGAAEESVAIGRDLERTLSDHQPLLLGARLEDFKDESLARLIDILDARLLGQLVHLVDGHLLQLGEIEIVLLGDVVLALELLLDFSELRGELLVGGKLAGLEARRRKEWAWGAFSAAATASSTTTASTTRSSLTLATTTTTTGLMTHL